ncbi:hypothetical protein [Nocardia brasiliensis]|uniref:hypothetical protein n=1 Tax=Nocardia brasiliensis TaxID=37326 RepID=UPI003D91371D
MSKTGRAVARAWSAMRRTTVAYIVGVIVLIILHRMDRDNEKLYPNGKRPKGVVS